MKALVTGGAGFLGRYIVEQLLARGDEVRIFCRGEYDFLNTMPVEVQRGDLRNPEQVERACEGIDAIFHAAAVPGIWGQWRKYYENNTLGTQHLLDSAKRQGVGKFLYTSSPSVIFDERDHLDQDESLPYLEKYLCHYPHSKALGEQLALAANSPTLTTCSIRPHLMWGPRDNHLVPRLLHRAKAGRLIQVGDGQNVISVIYVENAAAAHLQAADRLTPDSPLGGEAYFINEKEPVVLWIWIAEILKLAGLPEVKRTISFKTAYRIGTAMEWFYRAFRLNSEPNMTRFIANQLARSHTYKIEKAERDFDYQPIVSFEEGMRRLEADLPRMLEQA